MNLTDDHKQTIDSINNTLTRLIGWEWDTKPGNMIVKLGELSNRLLQLADTIEYLVGAIDDFNSPRQPIFDRPTSTPISGLNSVNLAEARRQTLDYATNRIIASTAPPPGWASTEAGIENAERLLEQSEALFQQVYPGRPLNSVAHPHQGPGEGVSVENLEIREQALETLPEVQSNPDLELPRVHGFTDMQLGVSRGVQGTNGTPQRPEQEGSAEEVFYTYNWTTLRA